MIARIDEARKAGDSLGGVVAAVARGVPAGLGRAGVRQAGGRPRQGDAVAAGGEGLRDRQRLRRHAADRQPAQRSVLRRRRARPHPQQPLGRRAGRHLQRRGHLRARRVQADRDDPARAGDRRRGRARHDDQGRAAATIRACCRARCRSSRRCWRWCSRIISSGSAASAGSAARRGASRSSRSAPAPAARAGRSDLLSLRVDAGHARRAGADRGAAPGPLHVHGARRGDVRLARQRRDAARAGRRTSRRAPSQARRPIPAPISSPGPWQEAVVDGLLPGTEYRYEVGHPCGR